MAIEQYGGPQPRENLRATTQISSLAVRRAQRMLGNGLRLDARYRVDLLVEDAVIVELKSSSVPRRSNDRCAPPIHCPNPNWLTESTPACVCLSAALCPLRGPPVQSLASDPSFMVFDADWIRRACDSASSPQLSEALRGEVGRRKTAYPARSRNEPDPISAMTCDANL